MGKIRDLFRGKKRDASVPASTPTPTPDNSALLAEMPARPSRPAPSRPPERANDAGEEAETPMLAAASMSGVSAGSGSEGSRTGSSRPNRSSSRSSRRGSSGASGSESSGSRSGGGLGVESSRSADGSGQSSSEDDGAAMTITSSDQDSSSDESSLEDYREIGDRRGAWKRAAFGEASPDGEKKADRWAEKRGMESRYERAKREFPRGSDYAGEEANYMAPGGQVPANWEGTKYYDDEERAAHELHANDGRLMRANGEAMDTSAANATQLRGGDKGRNIFGLAGDDEVGQRMYAADAAGETEASRRSAIAAKQAGETGRYDHTHHSSFTAGGDLQAAGDMEVKDGWVKRISNNSGHYTPDANSNIQAVEALDKMGVNTDVTRVESFADVGTDAASKQSYLARPFAASGGNTALLDGHDSVMDKIRAGYDEENDRMVRPSELKRNHGMVPRQKADERGKTSGEGELDPGTLAAESGEGEQEVGFSSGEGEEGPSLPAVTEPAVATSTGPVYDPIGPSKEPAEPSYEPLRASPEPQTHSYEPLRASEPTTYEPLRGSREPQTTTDAPLSGSLEPQTTAYEPLRGSLEPQTTAYEPLRAPETASTANPSSYAANLGSYGTFSSPRPSLASASPYDAANFQDESSADDDYLLESESESEEEDPAYADKTVGDWTRYQTSSGPSWAPGKALREREKPKDKAFGLSSWAYDREDESYFNPSKALPEGIEERTRYYDDAERDERQVHAADGLLRDHAGKAVDTTGAGKTSLKDAEAGRNIFAVDHDADHGRRMFLADAAKERTDSQAAALADHDARTKGASAKSGIEARLADPEAAKRYAAGDDTDVADLLPAADATPEGPAKAVEHTHHSSFTGGHEVDAAGDMRVKEGYVQRISNVSGHYTPDDTSNLQALRAMEKMGVNLDATTVEHAERNASNDLVTNDYQARAVLATGNDRPLMDTHKQAFDLVRGAPRLRHHAPNERPEAAWTDEEKAMAAQIAEEDMSEAGKSS